jgi:DNA mismatch repair protein MutS2
MDEKTLHTLEYDKIMERLAGYAAFSASQEKALALRPSANLDNARRRLAETREARLLLDTEPTTTIGGARDIRQLADGAERGIILRPAELLDIKNTLEAARSLRRQFEKGAEAFPLLSEIALRLPQPSGLIDAISRTLSERGDILDSASPKLGSLRREVQVVHARLLTRMQRMLTNPKVAPYLQDSLVTQRDGRYVLPVRTESKGNVKGVVHDQSSSGATLFIEPIQLVDTNNQWRELQLGVRSEEQRILAELSAQVGEQSYDLQQTVEILADLDLIFACAKYAETLEATEPVLHGFGQKNKASHPGVTLRLWQARHPLLPPEDVVPIDVELDPQTFVLVITGPNTGGKTVSLKTTGLLTLMAQAGLHIPALSGSELTVFPTVFADIGDEQSIEQSLSTFSGHITNIIQILEEANSQSLVIIDELGAGTDPQEGAALGRAILDHLVQAGITTLVATHYPELKTYAHSKPGVINASVEFDIESLRPTYHLTIGLPGRSNALAIAQRLGLQSEIVEAARSTIDPDDLRAEDLLNEIHHQRDLTRTARSQAETTRQETQGMRAELAERLEKIEDERLAILEQARQEALAESETLQEEIRKTRGQLARARQPLEALEQAAQQADEIEAEVAEPVERRWVEEDDEDEDEIPSRPLRLGDRVLVRRLEKEGVVISLSVEEAEVQIGVLRVRARLRDLELAKGGGTPEPVKQSTGGVHYQPESPGVELAIRGLRVDEALDALERHMDAAYLAGLHFVRVIHGKGTGKLREVVRKELAKNPHVERYETGLRGEGGHGVTVAFFKQG